MYKKVKIPIKEIKIDIKQTILTHSTHKIIRNVIFPNT